MSFGNVRSRGEQATRPLSAPGVSPSRVVSAVILVTLTRFALQVSAQRDSWIAFVPDDAFYYLGLGRGFASHGFWTFDDGVSASSGFHLLQGYVAAACWSLFHAVSIDAPVYALMCLSVLCNVLAVLVCARLASRIFGGAGALGVAMVFLSKNALVCGTSGMEWAMAVLALALAAEIAFVSVVPTTARCLYACGIGLLAVISRSDSAAWVTVFAVCSVLVSGLGNAKRVGALVFGCVLGSLVVALHTHAVTGLWLQDSVLAKLHWAKQRGFDLPGAVNTLGMVTGMRWLGKAVASAVLIALTLFGLVAARRARGVARVALIGSSVTVMAAIAIDARNSGGLQYWYTDGAVVPCVLLWSALFAYARERAEPRLRQSLSVAVAVCCVANLWWVREGAWRNQPAMLHAALRLKSKTWSACRVGSWNSGIIGYYREHDVINLDGLANHDAMLASESGHLASYLAQANVQYVVDFAAMLEREEFRARGGYDRPEERLALTEVERAPASEPLWLDSSIVYWRNQPKGAPKTQATDCRALP